MVIEVMITSSNTDLMMMLWLLRCEQFPRMILTPELFSTFLEVPPKLKKKNQKQTDIQVL